MKKIILITFIVIAAGAGTLFAIKGKDTYDASKYSASLTQGLSIGSTVNYTLPDQFDKEHTLDDSIEKLIIVFTKSTGHRVKEFLKKEPKEYLSQRKSAFVADISPMPVVIRNTFALPDLKKQHYSVELIYDKNIAKEFKKGIDTDSISIVTLDHKKITDIKQIESEEQLKEMLK